MSLVRNVFLTLLFVNLAYFAWSHWIDEPPPPPVNESIARLPRLKLASEDPPPPPSGHAAETGLTVSPALSVSPPPGCLSVGPFGDVDAAARAAALLRVEVVTRVQDRAMAASPAPQIAATRAVP